MKLAAEFAKSNWRQNLPSQIGGRICQVILAAEYAKSYWQLNLPSKIGS
jgi:hypothetical protein